MILNRVKIQNSKKSFKAKQMNIEATQISFFGTWLPIFIFLAL